MVSLPTLPHQTVHAVFPHTAFRCSSRRGVRRAPARLQWGFIQPVALMEIAERKAKQGMLPIPDLVAPHQVNTQPAYRVVPDFVHRYA